jgi:aldose 1-epimerase
MAPWAGRTRHGRFVFDGVEHHLPINLPPHAIHGTVRDRPWTAREQNPQSTRLSCDLGPAWPFAGWAEHELTLFDDRLEMALSVHSADGPMPAALGWHPWFRRRDRGAAPGADDVKPDIYASAMYERDDEHIVTRRLRRPPPPGPWDDCFTSIKRPPRLVWPGRLTLTIESSCPCIVVFSEPADAICIEPQTAPPDALNHDYEVVEPDRPLSARMTWRWSRA